MENEPSSPPAVSYLSTAFVEVDPFSCVAYLEVPKNAVVLLQVFFELYDGVAAVRTVQATEQRGAATGVIVCILTTPGQKAACIGLLNSLALSSLTPRVPWRVAKCELDPFITNAQQQVF